ncbi:ran GTPase-activating protein 1 [Cephus cinctus]|uniref:Ran GTPase-activating protein 1 n=1 Tax=Cephus cinctus TaxID=211228 RepID=A0AAJ7CD18_CEPCN|nr:ran GTPase-activating protein 1 [Cephus cinctus]XP_015607515.1 ran GTPase-activating protein 1 [Cephus cinctus]XP_015607525.1 ran GTPase-activating protein 1 [Cephus cinctus]XP_015607534.1 ran GTPase-activating protein 1 [Cephus cinctus]XP_015607544.1 ran GTPase-activating protein 1 [Cephus cinctus]XP_024946641.1 ran GTPase-activating protein 1 [Cephus cinctus]XP_024946642.1 ran GTPase-activating protein 1 [Cephus cinctus]
MTSFNLSEIVERLREASETQGTGVSFAGRSLKLDNEQDAEEVVQAIKNCECLEYLDLEGNTLGPEAAKAVSKALETHGTHLKRALWKDMFTGRMKTEIPLALEYLGAGLCAAVTALVELDLSDNAFGPIGVQGLAAFLSSRTCYTLKELRLNNNGLGISGGKILAKALLDCHLNSTREGANPLALKVFVAGRNRLENEGATALASVFKTIKTLEEVVMPQNGIYHQGVAALASGLSVNTGLRILNLNDNIVGPKGAQALANVLPSFVNLERLNLGDCLLKTKGALVVVEALGSESSHPNLTELNLTFNEIGTRAASPIANAMADKMQLTSLQLDGNAFGSKGRATLRDNLTISERIDSLGSLNEDESEDEDEPEDGDEDDDGDDEEAEKENESDGNVYYEENEDENENYNNDEENESDAEENKNKNDDFNNRKPKRITVQEFLKSPTGENLLLLQGDKAGVLIDHTKNLFNGDSSRGDRYVEDLCKIIMKVSTLCDSGYVDVRVEAEGVTEILYAELFTYAIKNNKVSTLNNALLVNLGLIKSEDKTARKLDWNLEGCFKALEKISERDYFLTKTKDTLKIFLEKPMKTSKAKMMDPFQDAKASLKTVLDRLQTT